MKKIKYLDEGHFSSRDLHRKRAWGEIGKITTYTNASLSSTYSLTVLTTLSEERPVIATLRKDSNTQWDFLLFLTYCIYQGHLSEDNYLIMDNAVHVGEDSFQIIELLLKAAGIRLVFLPTYSPELNAAEYVFQVTKTYIRNNRTKKEQSLVGYCFRYCNNH